LKVRVGELCAQFDYCSGDDYWEWAMQDEEKAFADGGGVARHESTQQRFSLGLQEAANRGKIPGIR